MRAPLDWAAIAVLGLALGCGGGGGDDAADAGIGCPDDMVGVGAVCVDRYEASQGVGDVAESADQATPWASVTWDQASAACEAAGKRLCSEDEWRAACRGDGTADYPYGDTYDPDACNGLDQENSTAQPTGSFPGCEGGRPGLFDMSGNVAEWTQTCSSGNCRQVGGSFTSAEANLTCTSGSMQPKGSTGHVLGFRCCKTP